MNYSDLITDFAKRTLANPDLVKRAADEGRPDAYEVTQLWNSLLGLIVLPRERGVRRLPKTKLAQLDAAALAGHHNRRRSRVGDPGRAGRHLAQRRRALQSLWNEVADDNGNSLPDHPHRWDGHLDIHELDKLARRIAATYVDTLGTRAA